MGTGVCHTCQRFLVLTFSNCSRFGTTWAPVRNAEGQARRELWCQDLHSPRAWHAHFSVKSGASACSFRSPWFWPFGEVTVFRKTFENSGGFPFSCEPAEQEHALLEGVGGRHVVETGMQPPLAAQLLCAGHMYKDLTSALTLLFPLYPHNNPAGCLLSFLYRWDSGAQSDFIPCRSHTTSRKPGKDELRSPWPSSPYKDCHGPVVPTRVGCSTPDYWITVLSR